MERVFEPFFTTKESATAPVLGCRQVYGFIKQSNGHIKIYSEPGQGTAVKLYLAAPSRGRGQSRRELPDAQEAPNGGTGELILVVEDDHAVRSYSDGVAARVGLPGDIGIRWLGGALAASGALSCHPPPVHGCRPAWWHDRAAAWPMRRDNERPDLQVLFTTGYARNAIVHGGVLDPGTHLLPKPFTYTALAAKIRALLDS